MIIDFNQQLTNIVSGQPMVDGDKQKVTLCNVCLEALMSVYADEKDLNVEKKMSRYDFALKIREGKVDITAPEVAVLVELINKRWGTIVAAPSIKMLQ